MIRRTAAPSPSKLIELHSILAAKSDQISNRQDADHGACWQRPITLRRWRPWPAYLPRVQGRAISPPAQARGSLGTSARDRTRVAASGSVPSECSQIPSEMCRERLPPPPCFGPQEDEPMPRTLRSEDAARYDDPDGTELPDDAAARDYAIRVIREVPARRDGRWRSGSATALCGNPL